MKQRLYFLGLLTLAILAAFVLACDSSNPVAPPGATLTLTANPTQISLSGSSLITIQGFKPDGNPLNPDTQINLSADIGVLDDQILLADVNGRAQTRLRSDGRPGPAMVTATLPGGGETMAQVSVQIGDEGIQPALIITATPNQVNIEQESAISVLARNVDQSPAANATVRLRTSLGDLASELLTTDANGEAGTILRPGNRSGTATITGTVGSSAEATADVTILTSQVTVQASPSVVDINPEGSTGNQANVTVLVRDENNVPLVEEHEVRLTATFGTLDPEVVTTRNGEGTAVYIAGIRPGSETITAFFANSASATANLDVRAAPAGITLTTSRSTIPSGNTVPVTLTAIVTDVDGLTLSGEVVSFTITEPAGQPADFAPGRSIPTSTQGQAQVEMTIQEISIPPVGTEIVVEARARGENIFDRVTIIVQ